MTDRRMMILYVLALGVALEILIFSVLFVLSQRNPLEQVQILFMVTATPTETPTLTKLPTLTPTLKRPSATPTATALPLPSATGTPLAITPAKPGVKPSLKPSATTTRATAAMTRSSSTPAMTRSNPTPTNTATIVVIEGTAIQFVSVVGGSPGTKGNVVVQTTSGANCAILYVTPIGIASNAPDLAKSKRADGNGRVEWSWTNEPTVKRGTGIAVVTCNGVSATAQINVQ